MTTKETRGPDEIERLPRITPESMPKTIEQQQLEVLKSIERLLGELVDNTRPQGTQAKYVHKKVR